eukprot:2887285-Rhodomonas_salina.1
MACWSAGASESQFPASTPVSSCQRVQWSLSDLKTANYPRRREVQIRRALGGQDLGKSAKSRGRNRTVLSSNGSISDPQDPNTFSDI